MKTFRVYVEETSVRLFTRTVKAATVREAVAAAEAALESGEWMTWDDGGGSQCTVEVLNKLTEVVK